VDRGCWVKASVTPVSRLTRCPGMLHMQMPGLIHLLTTLCHRAAKGSHSLLGYPGRTQTGQLPDVLTLLRQQSCSSADRARLINSPSPGKPRKSLSCLAPKKAWDSQRGSLCLPAMPRAHSCLRRISAWPRCKRLAQPSANIPGAAAAVTRLLLGFARQV